MEISEIKQRLSMATVLQYYNLKPDKHNRICCPFHEDKTPSMQVYYKTQTAYCFSSNCKTHGKSLDVIDFIMHKENQDKHNAILKAAGMLNGHTVPAVTAQAVSKVDILIKFFDFDFPFLKFVSPSSGEIMEKYQSHFVQRINSPYLMAIAKKLGCKRYKNEINQFETEVNSDDSISIRAADPAPVFYYHPDHLGTSTVISNSTGALHQYFFNLPFGETMIEGCTNSNYQLNYKFNAKELDAESGMYYYGARYYDPRISVWMSVDPLASDAPESSPYNAMWNNPILNVDPDGCWANPVFGTDGTYKGNTKEGYTGEVIIYDGAVDFSKMSKDELLATKGADTYDNKRSSLTGDAKSNIWTHIVSQLEGEQIYDETFSLSTLSDGKISFSSTDPGSWNSRIKSKTITGTDKYSYETTVENIQSSVVVHEWYSHIQKGNRDKLKSHRLAYKNVINYKDLWNKTTDAYKGFNMRTLLRYTKSETGRTQVDPLYRNLYKKYKDKY